MIHKYTMYDTNIVLDVNSGAVHVFDDAAFDVVGLYKNETRKQIIESLSEKYSGQVIEDAYEEISELESKGLLFSEDAYSDALNKWERKPVVKALCLHICHDCNLRCKYCFASTGSFGGHRTMMDLDTGKKAIDFLIEKSAGRRNLEVDFFGGEPLMNFDVVKGIVEYARIREKESGKNFRFTITTNAVLLNEEIKDFINKNMHNVVLSIDGRKETNDKMRPRVDGSGTYDRILPKIQDMAESRNQDNYYVRGTFTRENLDFSEDVLHLADQGFKQISIEPVVAAKDSGYDIREQDLPKLFEEYENLAREYVKRDSEKCGFNFFHFMIDLQQGPCVIKRLGGCGSGHEYLAVTPEGDLYPCHQFVGDEKFKMGNVHEGVFNSDSQKDFQKSNVYTKKDCAECWAKFYCSGGCAANAYQFNNDINVPYKIGCELEKKRVECAIWIKTQE
ncbi:thioether cross-link-forming SCIFF peptide maturase [Ruminiclostridium papyrosolvens]|uniref:Radical SAM protein n=1 Tax=Ruminiclostridium papyrosolvens C7 TaxID=1330534 RepID=U4R757_9FIRM|nr:thioether cross-link-forming SCIFF peptide maturase [Ruminiclostridium papyrosolvens]EPR13957.1 radical SAM protein [Ruminiclostridium papyrosolvens C7]